MLGTRFSVLITQHSYLSTQHCHLMTRSALASTLGGIVKSIWLAAFKVKVRANFVDCCTGTQVGSVTFEA